MQVKETGMTNLLAARDTALNQLTVALKSKNRRFTSDFVNQLDAMWRGDNTNASQWQTARNQQLTGWLMGIELLNTHTDKDFDFNTQLNTPNRRAHTELTIFHQNVKNAFKQWQIRLLMKVENGYLNPVFEASREKGIEKVLIIVNKTLKSPILQKQIGDMINKLKTCTFVAVRQAIEAGNSSCN